MLFSSLEFIFCFLPISLLGFFLIPAHPTWPRKVWLFVASVWFYAYWKIEYVPLLLFSMVFNYAVAELINRFRGRPAARAILITGIAVNLLLLGYYKYTNFILEVFGRVADLQVGRFDIILPLAISFFTFTQIGYLVDIYRDQSLHYKPLDYALFVVFFPHLIAGPIVRHWEIIPQFANRDLKPKLSEFSLGLALFLIGLYKKILLADPVAGYVATVYGAADQGMAVTWFDSWLGTIAFGLQIYFDFSGYSDMAIGLARLFGIKFPINFDSPYRAGSIVEFWKRWHISLTRFFREYVYFPMGGNRVSPPRQIWNIMATMLLSGLWHGAGWTFVIWGGLHGFFLVVAHRWRQFARPFSQALERWWYRLACGLLTWLAVHLTWVFFRASDLKVALKMIASMAGFNGLTLAETVTNPNRPLGHFLTNIGFQFTPPALQTGSYSSTINLVLVLLVIALFFPNSQQIMAKYEPALEKVERPSQWQLVFNLRSGLVFGLLFFWVMRSFYVAPPSPFLYFNF